MDLSRGSVNALPYTNDLRRKINISDTKRENFPDAQTQNRGHCKDSAERFRRAQLFAQTRTLRIRQMDGLEISTDKLDLAALGRGDLTTE